MTNLIKSIVTIPMYIFQVFLGILVALSSDTSVVLLLVAGVALAVAFGWAGVGIAFLAYALLRALSQILDGISAQINFLARVYRDNA